MSTSDDLLAELRRLAQRAWMSADRQGADLIRAFRALDEHLSAGGDTPAAWAGQTQPDPLTEPDVVLTKTEADMTARLFGYHALTGTLPVEVKELAERIMPARRDPGRPIEHAIACAPFHDTGSGVLWTPWADTTSSAVGWRATDTTTGRGEYVYFVPSETGELAEGDAGAANVFVYQGDAGDPVHDEPVHHYVVRLG